jgi:hypothetical protein
MRKENKYLPHKWTDIVMIEYKSRYFTHTVNFISEKLCPLREDWRRTVYTRQFFVT